MADPPPMLRPDNSIGDGLPHERTALAWERTAIAMIVAGIVLARHTTRGGWVPSSALDVAFTTVGVGQIMGGSLLLLWAVRNDRMLHDPALPASAVPQAGLTRAVGLATAVFTALAVVFAIVTVLT